jgi:hypothetical protein
MLEATARLNELLAASDWDGAAVRHEIIDALERLQAKAPAEGEKVH